MAKFFSLRQLIEYPRLDTDTAACKEVNSEGYLSDGKKETIENLP